MFLKQFFGIELETSLNMAICISLHNPPTPSFLSEPGPIWWKARPFWLPRPVGSPQCHPQADTRENPSGGRAQRWGFRLRHQLLRDGPRQPGQLPALTSWTVLDLKWGQGLKAKGTFCCVLQWRNTITEDNATRLFGALESPGMRLKPTFC